MRNRALLVAATAALAVALSAGSGSSLRAPSIPDTQPDGIVPVASSGTPGRIARFVNATDLGDSVLFQSGGRIGLGTTAPQSALDIRAQAALNISGPSPILTFRDTNVAAGRAGIRSADGGLRLAGEDLLSGKNPNALVHIDKQGRVGFGTARPQRAIQIGPGLDPLFTIEPSDASPRAGFIRFGDNTGWQLRIGRSRESSGGALNTGLTGALFTFRDDGAFGPTGYPLLATGVEHLCRTLANFITRCEASSLRYKTNIKPYLGGLDVVAKLQPIAFTRKYNGRSDIGLAAEDVEKVEPLFTYPNDEGKVEGIKYDLLTTVLINAVKEQQQQIAELKARLDAYEQAQVPASPKRL